MELAVVGESKLIANRAGLDSLIDSDTNLIVFRILIFSIFPLVMATYLVRARHIRLDRNALRPPFYSQCYVAAPFALSLGIAGTIAQCHFAWAPEAAFAIIVTTIAWYGWIQSRWFTAHLGVSAVRGFCHASVAIFAAILLTLTLGSFFT